MYGYNSLKALKEVFKTNKREQHISNLIFAIESKYKSFTYDKYGNFINDRKNNRFKFNKSVIRIEYKFTKGWSRINSYYYKDLYVKGTDIYSKITDSKIL